tara:strand:+ start:74 stop:853 length:780 start_codon:yes stop_codon:yes gene_type:complete
MDEEEMGTGFDLTVVYDAFETLGLGKDATDAYIHLLSSGPQFIDDIPISAHRRMKSIQTLVAKKFISTSRNGQYSARDPETVLREKVGTLEANIKTIQRATEELILSGQSSSTLPLNTADEFYSWEGRLFERAHANVDSLTVRFKLAWLMRDIIRERHSLGIKFRVLGCISTEETMSRAMDLHEAGADVRHTDAVEEMLRFILVDSSSVLFGFRDPNDPAVHIGAWMRSESFVAPLNEQFEAVWRRSKPFEDWSKIEVK